MTESKEWVTIKIPKEIRGPAQDIDSLTYGQLMALGVQAHTADVVGKNDEGDVWLNLDDLDSESSETRDIDNSDVDLAEIERKLDQIQGAQSDTVSKAMQLGELQDQQFDRIINRIDDLQAQLPKDVANEVQR